MTERTCPGCGEPTPPNKGPGRQRIWCSDRCRKLTLYTDPCPECGALMNTGGDVAKAPKRCIDCERTRNAEENERIRELWNEGAPEWYVREQLGLTGAQVRSRLQGMRERGEDVELHRARNRDRWPEIQRLWNEGVSGRVIADRLGINTRNVFFMLQTMRAKGVALAHHEPTSAKLTDEQVREIRSTNGTIAEAAERYGVSDSTISRARRRVTYAEVA